MATMARATGTTTIRTITTTISAGAPHYLTHTTAKVKALTA
ncbi:MAG: hypothetical protein SO471_18100 [Anaerobutyricum hallii]|nr:hypothetical protein [Anaerobutyricum hallii]